MIFSLLILTRSSKTGIISSALKLSIINILSSILKQMRFIIFSEVSSLINIDVLPLNPLIIAFSNISSALALQSSETISVKLKESTSRNCLSKAENCRNTCFSRLQIIPNSICFIYINL